MGKNSRARREARRRATGHAVRHGRPSAGPSAVPSGRDELVAAVELARRYVVDAPRSAGPRLDLLTELGEAATEPADDPAVLVVDEVLSRISQAWEHGWQPADLVHASRRRVTAPAAALMARAVLAEATTARAFERAPGAWVDQLTSLAGRRPRDVDASDLLPTGGRARHADWVPALLVLDLLHRLPPAQRLVPPPSQWDRVRATGPRRSTRPTSERAARMLPKIRALLAKAESTAFSAEAEALSAKAQDLMTRHAIDEALLADDAGAPVDVHAVRVLVHPPYGVEKAVLLDVVARANRTRSVWSELASYATLVGVPTDVAQTEMLFTSLLVQATRAMTQAGQGPDHRGPERSTAFRKAFLTAYATRIGERLAASADEAAAGYGSALVPVLQRQDEAVGGEFERLFPHVTTGSRRRSFDARGWDAGVRAADAAVLPAGEVGPATD